MIANAFAVIFVAVVIPLFMGLGLLSASSVIPLAGLSAFLVGDLVTGSYRGDVSLKWITRCVLRGWATGLVILALTLAVMNAMFWTGHVQLPAAVVLADAAALSFSASVLVAGIAVVLCRKTRSAKRTMKVILVAATLCLLYGCNEAQTQGWFFPTRERVSSLSWIASVVFLVSGVALIALAVRRDRLEITPR